MCPLLDKTHKGKCPFDGLSQSPRRWEIMLSRGNSERAAALLSIPFPAAVLLPSSPALPGAPSLGLSHHPTELLHQSSSQNYTPRITTALFTLDSNPRTYLCLPDLLVGILATDCMSFTEHQDTHWEKCCKNTRQCFTNWFNLVS